MDESDEGLLAGARKLVWGLLWALQFLWFVLILFTWNTAHPGESKLDRLAISITVMEVVLGVIAVLLALGAFFGTWMIRQAAIGAAQKEARQAIEEMAPRMFQEVARARDSGKPAEPEVGKLDESDIIESATEVTEDDNAKDD